MTVIDWPASLFATVDGGPVSDPLDLTGRVRLLLHGPHQVLPAGLWRIRARFRVRTEGAIIPLRFEWGGMGALTEATFPIEASGDYEATLDHAWPVADGAAIRLWVARPTFGGQLTFLGARAERLGEAPAQSAPNQRSQSS